MNSTPSPREKSPSSKTREIPLPRPKRTDPPFPALATDPRTWPARKRAARARRCFLRPQPPFPPDHPLLPEVVADNVVCEVIRALGLGTFPRRRWVDWLFRRTVGLYRISRPFRAHLNGPNDVEYCYRYQRHWLYIALHKSHWRYARLLPPEMHGGASPLDYPLAPHRHIFLAPACRRRLQAFSLTPPASPPTPPSPPATRRR